MTVFGASLRSRLIRAWTPLLVFTRVFALVLGLQFTGAAHLAVDVVSLVVDGHAEHEEQCPADRPCDDCPPGCPNCHCPNTLRSVPPESSTLSALPLAAPDRMTLRDDSTAPSGPDLPSLFRPPRIQTV